MRRAAFALLLAACGGDFRAGVDAYRAGRFDEARAAFARAEEEAMEAGADAPVALRANRALAALRAGDLQDAERTLARAEPAGGPWLDFLRGNVAFARCERAERQAQSPMAEPFAFDVAIRHAGAAREAWERAAMGRDDWPAARRNVERALGKLRDLRRQKAQREEDRRKESDPRARLNPDAQPPPPPPPPESGTEETAAPAGVTETELTPEQVARLLERLAAKEREKRAARSARQREHGAGVERDW